MVKISTVAAALALVACSPNSISAKNWEILDGDQYACQTRELVSQEPDANGEIEALSMKKSPPEELFSFKFHRQFNKQNLQEAYIEFDDNHWWLKGWKLHFWFSNYDEKFDDEKFGFRFDRYGYTDFYVSNGPVTVAFQKTTGLLRVTLVAGTSLSWLLADCRQVD
jgi:hypothetical protein